MHTNHLNWIIGPAASAVKLLAEETATAGLLKRSLVVMAGLRPLLNNVKAQLRAAGTSTAEVDALLRQQDENECRAKEILLNDYDPIVRHGVIGMWVCVEVAVEDTATLVLQHDPSALSAFVAGGPRFRHPLPSTLNEEGAGRIYKKLERHSMLGRGVGEAYCHLLNLLDVPIAVDSPTLDVLSELNYVRNCWLHRSGRVDAAALAQAPSLGVAAGEQLKVPSERYLHYFVAASSFVVALLDATSRSRYVVTV